MSNKKAAILLIVVSLIILAGGFYLLQVNRYINENMIEHTGIVTECDSTGMGDDRKYDVKFTYTYDNENFTAMFSSISTSYKTGSKIVFYMNPDNPAEINRGDSQIGAIFCFIGGAIFLSIGIMLLIKKKNLPENMTMATMQSDTESNT